MDNHTRGGLIIWDSSKYTCLDLVLGSISVSAKLVSIGEGDFWLASVHDANISTLKKRLKLSIGFIQKQKAKLNP